MAKLQYVAPFMISVALGWAVATPCVAACLSHHNLVFAMFTKKANKVDEAEATEANEADVAGKPNKADLADANEANKAEANEADEVIVINEAIGAKETN